VPKSRLTVQDAVRRRTVSKDCHKEVAATVLAEAVVLIEGALGDCLEAMAIDIDLNLVTSVGIVDSYDLGSIWKSH
jgi:hypothetical protein